MENTLQAKCQSFIQNRDTIRSTFAWNANYLYPVCASIFTEKNILATPQKLQECKAILKKHAGIFSNFRGTAELAVISMLAVDEQPESKLINTLTVYEKLKNHFFSSEYLVLAAMTIADLAEPYQYDELAARTRRLYNLMKNEHPFLTSGEDSVFAALLALSPKSDDALLQDMESCYHQLKGNFFSGNSVQSLSHVLALGEGTSEEKCRKTMELFNTLKANGRKYGTSYELASLGVLALLPVDLGTLLSNLLEADAFLSRQKGYGILGPGDQQRLMHAGILVSGQYIGRMEKDIIGASAISSAISLIIAQQVALCTILATSAAVSATN